MLRSWEIRSDLHKLQHPVEYLAGTLCLNLKIHLKWQAIKGLFLAGTKSICGSPDKVNTKPGEVDDKNSGIYSG